jgi:hypothetical protein
VKALKSDDDSKKMGRCASKEGKSQPAAMTNASTAMKRFNKSIILSDPAQSLILTGENLEWITNSNCLVL